jgi:hypothetical protein
MRMNTRQVFEQNYGRCHNALQGFSPSISGTGRISIPEAMTKGHS